MFDSSHRGSQDTRDRVESSGIAHSVGSGVVIRVGGCPLVCMGKYIGQWEVVYEIWVQV